MHLHHFVLDLAILNEPAHDFRVSVFMLEKHIVQFDNELVTQRDKAFLDVIVEVELGFQGRLDHRKGGGRCYMPRRGLWPLIFVTWQSAALRSGALRGLES